MSLQNNKDLGQNWLKNRAILDEIAELADDGKAKLCVEIGPGLGTLTSSLFRHFKKVIAVEFDERLAENLPKSFPGKNLEVICQDILKYDFETLGEMYVVVGNIPYYITSPIIKKILETTNKPARVVLLIQKEVAERITDEKETVLSLFVKNHAEVFAGPVVPKEEFTPMPKVDSQVIVMELFEKPMVDEKVFGLIRRGFSAPRKKLVHNLAGIVSKKELIELFIECDIPIDARAGDVGLMKWDKLYRSLLKD